MGHSFSRRFELFLSKGVDARVRRDLKLSRSGQITFLGVGGSTVDKLSKFDLHLVRRLQPQIVILESGSNDLSPPDTRPEVVGSKIETLVQRLHAECRVETIVVCQTINRAAGLRDPPSFNDRVALLISQRGAGDPTFCCFLASQRTSKTHLSHFMQRRGTP